MFGDSTPVKSPLVSSKTPGLLQKYVDGRYSDMAMGTQLPGYANPHIYIYTLWLFNIAMENGPFIDGLPIKNGDFPWLC
jgi:hypothetical protein